MKETMAKKDYLRGNGFLFELYEVTRKSFLDLFKDKMNWLDFNNWGEFGHHKEF